MAIGDLMSGAGRVLLVLGLAGTGALCLAYANGALLIALSFALLIPALHRIGGYTLAAFLVLWVLAFALPRIVAGEEAAWLAPAEVLTVAIGAWVASDDGRAKRPVQVLFG